MTTKRFSVMDRLWWLSVTMLAMLAVATAVTDTPGNTGNGPSGSGSSSSSVAQTRSDLPVVSPAPSSSAVSASPGSSSGSGNLPSNVAAQSSAASPSSSSASLGNYYTNDLSAFLAALPVAGGSSPSSSVAGKSSVSSQMTAAAALPAYQALLQAIAQSTASPQHQSPAAASASSANALLSSLLSSASAAPSATWMTLPSGWSSALAGNTGTGGATNTFMSMLRPSQPPIGGRRSSLTSRLRNIMNALFYRRETSSGSSAPGMMTSGSSYSYAYRPAPYGFGAGTPEASSSISSLYGGTPGTGASSYLSSLYGDTFERYPGSLSSPSSTSSLYGAASNYRPSFVALPPASMLASGGSSGGPGSGWSSPSIASDTPPMRMPSSYGSKPYGGYGMGMAASNPHHSYQQSNPHYHHLPPTATREPNNQGYQGGPDGIGHHHQAYGQTGNSNNQWSSPVRDESSSGGPPPQRGIMSNSNPGSGNGNGAIWSSPYFDSRPGDQIVSPSSSVPSSYSYYQNYQQRTGINGNSMMSASSSIDRQSSSVPSPTYPGTSSSSATSNSNQILSHLKL